MSKVDEFLNDPILRRYFRDELGLDEDELRARARAFLEMFPFIISLLLDKDEDTFSVSDLIRRNRVLRKELREESELGELEIRY